MKLGIEDVHFVTQSQPSLPSLWTQVIDHLTTPAGADRLGTRDAFVTNLLTLRAPATQGSRGCPMPRLQPELP